VAGEVLTKRDKYLRRTYGITQADYDTMLRKQRGVCAICKKPPKEGKNLQVDHDHVTQLVRGLLCWSCNHRFIGRERDPVRFDNGAEYLRNPPAVRHIGEHFAPAKKRKRRRKT